MRVRASICRGEKKRKSESIDFLSNPNWNVKLAISRLLTRVHLRPEAGSELMKPSECLDMRVWRAALVLSIGMIGQVGAADDQSYQGGDDVTAERYA